MGKGTGELEGLVQLAGGLLVGGLALFQLTRDGEGQGKNGKIAKDASHGKESTSQSQGKEQGVSWVSQRDPQTLPEEAALGKEAWRARADSDQEEAVHHPTWMSGASSLDEEEIQALKNAVIPLKAAPPARKAGAVSQRLECEFESKTPSVYDSESDQSTSEEEEEYVPSWMSTKEPQTAPIEVLAKKGASAQHRSNAYALSRSFRGADENVSRIAMAFSDSVFVYPGAGKSFFGSHAVFENSGRAEVHVMETRAGAGEAVVGALSSGAHATVLASSGSLKEMLPSLFEMSQQRLPAVLHVAALSVDEELVVRQDLSEVMSVRDSGLALLSSGSAQEAHDLAVVAHAVSRRTSSPVLHMLDGARVAAQTTSVEAASASALEGMAKYLFPESDARMSPTALRGLEVAAVRDAPHLAVVMQQTMKELAGPLGHEYHIIEYSGPLHAEAVVVALGVVASVCASALAGHPSVGVLKVRLLKPWSAHHLLAALPRSVRRVCVLDQGDSHALLSEVAASFHTEAAALRGGAVPALVPGSVLPSAGGFTPAMARAAVANLLADHPAPHFTLGSSNASMASLSLGLSAKSGAPAVKSVVVFASSKLQSQVGAATRAVAAELAASAGVAATQHVSVDSYSGESGVVRAEVRLTPDGAGALPEAYEVCDATVVLVQQSLVAACGATAALSLAHGGCLAVLADSDKRLALPADVRSALASRNARVALVDARGLVENARQAGALPAPGQDADLDEVQEAQSLAHAAGLWIALAAALHAAKGAEAFSRVVPALKQALHAVQHMLGPHAKHLGSILGSGMQRVAGYVTELSLDAIPQQGAASHHAAFSLNVPSPAFPVRRSAYLHDEDDLSSVVSAGNAYLSPIATHHKGAAAAAAAPAAIKHFLPRMVVDRRPSARGSESTGLGGKSGAEIVKVNHKAALTKIFPEAYAAAEKLRPTEHEVHLVRLTKNKRLTPLDYERNIFHLEFDISGTSLKYQIGDALGVYGHNDLSDVDHFIHEYGLNPNDIIAVPARKNMEQGTTEMVSVRNLLIQHLDILGKPAKKFYLELAAYATTRYENLKLWHIGTDDTEAFKLGMNEGVTYAEILLQYKSARPTIEQIIEMVPLIQPRHYSIASSMNMNPRSVHLLVVAVDWKTPLGRTKFGQCTRYLSSLDPSKGQDIYVTVDVMPSVLRLPADPKTPIIMSGLGTGMAPFRAFVQERKFQREMGIEVGPVVLYFGARHRHEEWLYGDMWDQYLEEGLVTRLGLAFSRDQKEKIYIQDRIVADKVHLKKWLGEQGGYFYLCGPTWPVPAITKAINDSGSDAEKMKEEGRYILEVY